MRLSVFKKEDYSIYKGWFNDELLNKALGPIDQEWLAHILSSKEGTQYCIWQNEELIAVLGVVWANELHPYHTISDFAVRPNLRGEGLGKKILSYFFETAKLPKQLPFLAHVMPENKVAFQFFSKLGWEVTHFARNEDDMHTFQN